MKSRKSRSPVAALFRNVLLWILVPAGLFFVGYRFVGPRIGDVPALRSGAQQVQEMVTQEPSQPAAQASKEPDPAKVPDVEVSVRKAEPRRRERTERSQEPRGETRRETSEPPTGGDPASSVDG
jgi:hypothetical protein